jgi:hypothetical protein
MQPCVRRSPSESLLIPPVVFLRHASKKICRFCFGVSFFLRCVPAFKSMLLHV